MRGDPKLLIQVFSNLLSNAINYSPGGAQVRIQAAVDAGIISVTVEDQGVGIPPQDIRRIFDRYYRGSNVTSFVGTGVGLFLVATVVHLHGGNISVESSEGKGSRFTVTLPTGIEASSTTGETAPPDPSSPEAMTFRERFPAGRD